MMTLETHKDLWLASKQVNSNILNKFSLKAIDKISQNEVVFI